MLTNPPFMRDPKNPPLHLRDLTPEEFEQWWRMRRSYEALSKLQLPKPELQRLESLR